MAIPSGDPQAPSVAPDAKMQPRPLNTAISSEADYPAGERQLMLELARGALATALGEGQPSTLPPMPDHLGAPGACFVTLTKHGALRGCVGNIAAHSPLYLTVMENARRAALRDPRFPPVERNELQDLKIEISVLKEPRPLRYSSPEELLSLLQPHQDGVLLQIQGRLAMFLPQVWEQLPDKEQFLNRLAQKAGCEPSAWREKDAAVSVYSVECFGEN